MRPTTLLLMLLIMPQAVAAELTPTIAGNRVGIEISGLQLPALLATELKSGLTNRLLLRVALLANAQRHREHAVEIAAKYDLWDERFVVTISVDGKTTLSRTEADSAAMLQFFNNPRVPGVFTAGDLPDVGELQLQVDALLNPIDRERMEQMRRWVAENSAYTTQSGLGGPARPSTAPIVNALFNRIFEQFSAGEDLAGAWHQSLASHTFQRRNLEP
jgi:hypothetical protein